MEYYQEIQNRAAQTAAVIKPYFPTMSIAGISALQLAAQAQDLGQRAQQRDDALAAFDAANSAENQGFLALRTLILALPRMAQGELDDGSDARSALLDRLSPVFAVDSRNSELAVKRGKKLISALTHIAAHLAAQSPPRPPIRSGGKGVLDLAAAIDAHTLLAQQVEDRRARRSLNLGALHRSSRVGIALRKVASAKAAAQLIRSNEPRQAGTLPADHKGAPAASR